MQCFLAAHCEIFYEWHDFFSVQRKPSSHVGYASKYNRITSLFKPLPFAQQAIDGQLQYKTLQLLINLIKPFFRTKMSQFLKSNKLNRAKFVGGDHYNHCVTLLPRCLSRGHLLSSDVINTATINERILWVIIIQRTKVPYA